MQRSGRGRGGLIPATRDERLALADLAAVTVLLHFCTSTEFALLQPLHIVCRGMPQHLTSVARGKALVRNVKPSNTSAPSIVLTTYVRMHPHTVNFCQQCKLLPQMAEPMFRALHRTVHASPHLLSICLREGLGHPPVSPTVTGGNQICNSTALQESGHLNILVEGLGEAEHFLYADSDNGSLCVTAIAEVEGRKRLQLHLKCSHILTMATIRKVL